MRTSRTNALANVVLATALLLGTTAVDAGETAAPKSPTVSGEDEFLKPRYDKAFDELQFAQRSAILRLPNGNVLEFIAVRDDRGLLTGVALTEVQRAGRPGVSSIPNLTNAGPAAIFHALTKPASGMPAFLRPMRSKHVSKQPQGWARDRILFGNPPAGGGGGGNFDCPQTNWSWNSFRNGVQSLGYTLSFLSEGDGPESQPTHWSNSSGFLGAAGYDELNGGVDDTTSFYFSVLYCEEEEGEGSSGTPNLAIRYRFANNWHSGPYEQFYSPGDQVNFWWTPFLSPLLDDPQSELGMVFDFRVKIDTVVGADKFYIGAAWNKPFGTLTNPQ